MNMYSPRRRLLSSKLFGSLLVAAVLVLLLASAGLSVSWAAPNADDDAKLAPEGLSSLGDTVWLDLNQDGSEDGGEPGIQDVVVNLYLDGGDFIFDPGDPGSDDTDMGSQITTGAGFYKFENIDALGNWYWVEIDASNFLPGGPLEGHVLTSGFTIGASPLLVQLPGAINDYQNADFGYAPLGQVLVVTKTVDPTSRPEPGGNFDFTVRLDNTSTVVNLIIDSLVDDIHGDLDGQGTCDVTPPKIITPGSFYQCSFPATFTGDPGDTETDTVTAEGEDEQGNPVSDSDDATVEITDVPSTILVTKTASPTSLPEPGGNVSFTVQVQNTSIVDDVTIDTLTDSIYGDLHNSGTCSVPRTLSPGQIYTCVFTENVSGNAGDSETDVVTASGTDDDGVPVSDDDDATVTIANTPSSINVTKTANPTNVAEPGGSVTFTVRVANTSSVDTVTINSLIDDIHGDLDGQGNCSVPQTITAGNFYECSFPANVSGNAGDFEVDTVIATGVDDDGDPVSDSDDARVDITDVPSSIDVTKTANPTSVAEPGGSVNFTVRIDNTSQVDSVNITSLVDSIHGDLNGQGSCSVPQSIAAGNFYQCVFSANVIGNAGDSETDVVTATGTDDDGNTVSDFDDATVNITGIGSSIQVTKTANPTNLPEPGGLVNFTVRIDNTSTVDVITINSLVDDIHGNLHTQGSCSVPQIINPGSFYQCVFFANVAGNAGDFEIDTVTATGVDDDGEPVSDSDDARVDITDLPASMQVTKTANPTFVQEPGGSVVFTVRIDNTSMADSITINSLVDDIHGDLNGQGGCSVPKIISAGGFYECSFTATVSGNAGGTETDVVTASGIDDDGNPISDFDDATVDIIGVGSSIQVTKTANPTSVQEPGGSVNFTVRIDNTSSVDTVTINTLDDDIHGDLNGEGTCSVPQTILPGNFYQCNFSATVTGNAGDSETDIVTATGVDDDGEPVSDSDDARVDITDTPSSINVIKTASPLSVPEPGGNVSFTVQVQNTSSADSIDITSLVDSVYGNLDGKGTCFVPRTLAPGTSFQCSFTEAVTGNAGEIEIDVVTATGTDDDGNPVSDSDDATVTITDVPSSIQVTKTANPISVEEPGGVVTFSVRIDNTSNVDAVTINTLNDSIHGNLDGRGSCLVPQTIAAGSFYQCSFTATVSGNAGDIETDIVTATGVDDDGNPVSDSDDATVTVTDLPSAIEVIKTASPDSIPEPGGVVTFSVRVNNISAVDSVTITSLVDSIHGNLNGRGTCFVPQTIPAGGFYQCSFTATVTGVAGYVERDVVTATGVDDDGNPVSGSDDATVTITQPDVTPTHTPTNTPTMTPTPEIGCAIVRKIDDQGFGLPAWEIHGRPVGQQAPHRGGYTDGTGYVRFDGLQAGKWNFWEIMQAGWEPVTAEMVEVDVSAGLPCAKVSFINRQVPFCVEGYKIDDDHIGLPDWEIHALPTSGWPHRVTYTDAGGYFRFDNLTIEEWRFWEIMQDGWEPVTADTFTIDPNTHPNPPPAGQCYEIRFKNKQVLPPTATPTPVPPTATPTSVSPTATPTPRITSTPTPTPGVCETGRLEMTIWGRFYSIPLDATGIIHPIYPLPWQTSTEFNIVGYTGPTLWTLYQPYWHKQVDGYQYSYPGDHAGEDFTLFVETDCGTIQLQTAVDDPTATPNPDASFRVWLPVINSPF